MAPAAIDPETPPIAVTITFSSSGPAAAVGAGQADREDGDRDRGLHHLAHLQARVGRGHREDDAEEEPPAHRADRGLRHRGRGRYDRLVRLTGGERQVGVRGERSGVGSVHSASGARAGRAKSLRFAGAFQGVAVAAPSDRGGSRVPFGSVAGASDPNRIPREPAATRGHRPWRGRWPCEASGPCAGDRRRRMLALVRVTVGWALVGVVAVLAAGPSGAADDEASRRLAAAVARGDAAQAKALLRQGADPDAADRSGWTGLHQAAEAGDLSLARAFLEAGARPDLRSRARGTPLDVAERRGGSSSPGSCGSTARRAPASRSVTRCASGPGAATATAPSWRPRTPFATASASRGSSAAGPAASRSRPARADRWSAPWPRIGRRALGARLLPHAHGCPVTADRPCPGERTRCALRSLPARAQVHDDEPPRSLIVAAHAPGTDDPQSLAPATSSALGPGARRSWARDFAACGGGGGSPSTPDAHRHAPARRRRVRVQRPHPRVLVARRVRHASGERLAARPRGDGRGLGWPPHHVVHGARRSRTTSGPSPTARTTTTRCARPSTRCTRWGSR